MGGDLGGRVPIERRVLDHNEIHMFFKRVILLICLVPTIALSQQNSGSSRIQNENELVFALLNASATNQSTADSLLRDHKNLITEDLWQRLTDTAVLVDPARATALFADAARVADELRDRRLIATTFYKIGRYQFSHGNISLAIATHLRSKQVFEETAL